MTDALAQLLTHPALWRACDVTRSARTSDVGTLSSGFARLDRELPEGGWPMDDLSEILLAAQGHGELPLLIPALATLSQDPRQIAWINPPCLPYAPALAAKGVRLPQLLMIRARPGAEALWAMEQCLASGACSSVLGWHSRLLPVHIRRLQQAAQRGRCWGVLLRPAQEAANPSPAPLRIELGTLSLQGQFLRHDIRILKRRGGWGSDWFSVHMPTPLAVDMPSPANTALTPHALTPSPALRLTPTITTRPPG